MLSEEKSKDDLFEKIKRVIPNTESIENCRNLGNCMSQNIRLCSDMEMLCIMCRGDKHEVLGGLSFLFDTTGMTKRNIIVIYRYNEAEGYIKAIEGKGFNDILSKYEKDDTIKEMTERTKLKRDEKREAEDKEKIEAFKRQDIDILVIRKNSKGEYEPVDRELIKIAKEKEKKTGKSIKIVDEGELNMMCYVLSGIDNNSITKIKREAQNIMDADPMIVISFLSDPSKGGYFLGMVSMYDDILGNNENKDKWLKYFAENYGLNLFKKFNKDKEEAMA